MTDPLATAMLSPTNIAMMSSVGQKDQFDFIPLVIEIVFLGELFPNYLVECWFIHFSSLLNLVCRG